MFWKNYSALKDLREQIYKEGFIKEKPKKMKSVKWFWNRTKFAVKFILQEKEVLFFAFLQWLVVIWVYYLWVQMLWWIPEEVWESAKESDSGSIVDLILIVWSFLCVGIATFPIGILSWCMWVSYILKKTIGSSDIGSCFKMVLPNAWKIWLFSWIDWWITVNRIFDRIPSKDDRQSATSKALEEALYYAWKVGTLPILPALSTGRSIWSAIKDSFELLKMNTKTIILTRTGYSIFCWIVWVWSYILWVLWLLSVPSLLWNTVFSIYMIIGIPLGISLWIVILVLRPIYIITSFAIYENYLAIKKQKIVIEKSEKGTNILILFLVFIGVISLLYLYREPLWLIDLLSTPYK